MRFTILAVAMATALVVAAAALASGSGDQQRRAFPVTVTNCGKPVRFDAAPKRAVAMDQVATEAMLAMGLAPSMVGTANQADPVFPSLAKAFAKVPVLAKGNYPSKEVLLTASPDIVVGNLQFFTYSGFPPGANFTRPELADRDIQGFTLLCDGESKSMPLLYRRYVELGRIFGREAQAKALVKTMKDGLGAVGAKLKGVAPVKTFYYSGGKGPLGTYGGAQDGLTLSGGSNLFKDLPPLVGGMPPTVTVEQVIERNPAVILIEDQGALDPSAPSVAASKAWLTKTLRTTDAVKNARFCTVRFYDFTGGLRMVAAVRQIARCLHPDVKF